MTPAQKIYWIEKLKKRGIMNEHGQIVAGCEEELLRLLDYEFVDNRLELDRLNVTMETTSCTISWVNKNGEYIGVNNTLAELCGLKIQDFIGKPVGFYTRNKFFSNFTDLLFKSNETSIYQEIETSINNSDRRFWVVGTKFDHGEQAIIIGIDISEIKHLEDSVSFMEKLSSLGEMVAGIVHEINNPLQVISMENQRIPILIKKNELTSVVDSSQKVDKTIKKISRIISGVKNFVRQGHKDPDIEFQVNQVIEDAIVLCEGKFKQNNVKIEFNKTELPLRVKGNYTQIFQIFTNLFTNAVDALENFENKWIKVEVEDNQDFVSVKVIDSGDGIPSDMVNDIFKSFFTTKALGKGTGLGLSLSKKIAQEHGGDLVLDTKAANTTFVVKIPTLAKAA